MVSPRSRGVLDPRMRGDDERMWHAPHQPLKSSYAGLTRVSILEKKHLAQTMDCRVKPGNDEFEEHPPQIV